MPDKVEAEIFIAMNEDGNYVVSADDNEVLELFDSDVGGICRKVVKLTVKITPPEVEEVSVDIPDTAGETTQVEAESSDNSLEEKMLQTREQMILELNKRAGE